MQCSVSKNRSSLLKEDNRNSIIKTNLFKNI